MRLLALETSELCGSVAAFDGEQLLRSVDLDRGQRSARALVPTIVELWREVGWKSTDVELVAVGVGPGSFTGLRVGITAAKTIAYAVGAEVMGISTLAAIASREPESVTRLSAAIDAQRGQVAAQIFERNEKGMIPVGPFRLLDIADWIAEATGETQLAGPVLRKLAARLGPNVATVPPECWDPTAESIGRLALARHAAGDRDDLWQLVPVYSRRAAAEEKLDEKKGRES